MRTPGAAMLASWLAYHRAIGFGHFLLYFDDPDDPDLAVARAAHDVTAIPRDAALMRSLEACTLWPRWGGFATEAAGPNRLVALQVLHIEHALAQIAARRRPIDWLLHIDHDELFFARGDDARAQFATIDQLGTDHVIFANHEAIPETLEVDDVFREVTLFKRNPAVVERLQGKRAAALIARRFLAYVRGKAAVRVAAGALPSGPHAFVGIDQPLRTRHLEQPCVLHYPNCGFARWKQKYLQLGDFTDRWFSGSPIRLRFFLKSRDLRFSSPSVARAYYRERAMLRGPAERDRLRASGLVVRVRGPSRLLARLARLGRIAG